MATEPLTDAQWQEVRKRSIFECCKWDIQSEDQSTLADFTFVLQKEAWHTLAAWAERLTAEALDWKTGKRYGHNSDQMELFALGVMCKYPPVKHVTTRLIYLDEKGKDIEDYAEFPATHRQRLIDKWTRKVEPMFTDKVFAPRPNDKCKWCPLARSRGGKCSFG